MSEPEPLFYTVRVYIYMCVYMGVVRCGAEVDERKHKKSGRADHPIFS